MSTPDKPGRQLRAKVEAALQRIWFDPNPGFTLGLVGLALRPLSALTGWVASQRRRQIDQRRLEPDPDTATDHQAFVIVVGNLVAGGAGKTPITLALASALTQAGYSVGLMCRGGPASQHVAQLVVPDTKTGQFDPELGDEAVLLARSTGLPVAIGWRRSLALRLLCELPEPPQVIISDDGLQHVALRRDIELVVVDSRGLGNGRLLPAGPLREPVAAALSANAIVLNAGWMASLASPFPSGPQTFTSHLEVRDIISLKDYLQHDPCLEPAVEMTVFDGKSLAAVATIANPGSFFDLLERLGLTVKRYAPGDHASLTTAWLNSLDEDIKIITEKDAVKCGLGDLDNIYVLRIAARPEPGLMSWLCQHLTEAGMPPNGPTNS
ncbi:MAG: tetraacyldisaccharide 4'-kinase [Burkholderiaceae bacterium]